MKSKDINFIKHYSDDKESNKNIIKVYEYIFSLISNEGGNDEEEDN